MTSFFVDPSKGTVQPPETGWESHDEPAPRWGHEKRSCDECGATWGQFGCTRAGCTSVTFKTELIAAVPFTTRIQEKFAPKAKPPRATRAQVESLRALQAAVTALIADLRRSDQELIAAVRGDVEELIPAQALVHRSQVITGDRSPRNIDGVGHGLESLADFLGAAIQTLEEPKPK